MGFNKTNFSSKRVKKGPGFQNCLHGNFEDKYKVCKYYGDRPIIYRSSLELKYMINLERNPEVEKWSSEKIVIPYIIKEKIDGKYVDKKRNYHTDFIVHMKNGKIYVVEIKPYTLSPRTNNQIRSNPMIYKNACKWKAAISYCKLKGYEFKVITDQDIK